MYRRSKTILLSSTIVIVATIIILLLSIKDWTGITGFAFATIIWSELFLFIGLIFVEWLSNKSVQTIIRSGFYVVIVTYSFVNIILSLIYMKTFKTAKISFVVFEVLFLATALVLGVILVNIGHSLKKSNDDTMINVNRIEAIVERLDKLAVCPECKEFSVTINKLSDALRFTDMSKSTSEDVEISREVEDIEIEIKSVNEKTNGRLSKVLTNLNALISQRNIDVNAMQKGKI